MIEFPDPRQVVDEYVAGVLSGAIPTGQANRRAIERYLHDCEHAEERGIYFDEVAARQGVLFFPYFCKHTIGAQFEGKPFVLEPWQTFCTWNICGWRRRSNGLRRFKKVYVTVSAKSGKTTWMAGLALMLAIADYPVEAGPQIYIVATKLDQARILYDEAVKFTEQTPELDALVEVYKAPHRIEIPHCHGLLRPIALDSSMDGFNAHGIFVDEIHAMREKHRDGREKLKSRTLARQQPIEAIITTAGDERSLLWQEEDDYANLVVESAAAGTIIDDTYFAFVARLDPDDDPFDEANWIKANPSLGVTIPIETIREEANRAQHDPVARNEFFRYKCNIKVSSSLRAIDPIIWEKAAKPLTVERGAYGHGGIDLARTQDWAAVGLCFPVGDGYEIKGKCFTCRCDDSNAVNVDVEPFRSWIRLGLLECSEGTAIDFNAVKRQILAWHEEYSIETWAFDPDRAESFAQDLQEVHGLKVFSFTQSHRYYNEPCTLFLKELKEGKIIHGGEEVTKFNFANLALNVNVQGLVMPDKSHRRYKIDEAVATLMAYSECKYAEKNRPEGSLIIT